MKAYASFADWKRDQSPRNQRLITALATLVKRTAPKFTPTVKWGQGCWTLDDRPRAYIHAEPDHVQFGFYDGSRLDDPDGLLAGKGKHVRHVRIQTAGDMDRKALTALIRQVRWRRRA